MHFDFLICFEFCYNVKYKALSILGEELIIDKL